MESDEVAEKTGEPEVARDALDIETAEGEQDGGPETDWDRDEALEPGPDAGEQEAEPDAAADTFIDALEEL